MKYRIEGFDKKYPDGYVLERDTAAGAMEAFHTVADLCGDAQVFSGEHPVMLSKLHELAEQEKQAAKGDNA